jgi:hypothetical protein
MRRASWSTIHSCLRIREACNFNCSWRCLSYQLMELHFPNIPECNQVHLMTKVCKRREFCWPRSPYFDSGSTCLARRFLESVTFHFLRSLTSKAVRVKASVDLALHTFKIRSYILLNHLTKPITPNMSPISCLREKKKVKESLTWCRGAVPPDPQLPHLRTYFAWVLTTIAWQALLQSDRARSFSSESCALDYLLQQSATIEELLTYIMSAFQAT